jgi:hypothetical protein
MNCGVPTAVINSMVNTINWQVPMPISKIRLMMLLSALNVRKSKFAEGDAFMDLESTKVYIIIRGELVEMAGPLR